MRTGPWSCFDRSGTVAELVPWGVAMTESTITASPERSARFFGTATIVCLGYAALALLLMHVLRPDYSPMSHMISDYGVGPYGWVMQTVFVGMSLGNAMLFVGLAQSGPVSIAARVAIGLLAIASVGLIVSAIFPTDLPGGPSTSAGHIHTLSFLVNIASLVLAFALLTVSFGGDRRWRSYRRSSAALLSAIVLAFALQFLTLRKGAPYGLANRFFVVALFAWMFATAYRLRNLPRKQAR